VSHSTVERDYLTNGFWAKSKEEELPCKGLTITRLVYMEDAEGLRPLYPLGEQGAD
ncbi:MAG: S46 family peptidase, partial [Alistipes sp.]|nr:S46 family peptidase [Alistipes sp.]